MIFQLTKYKNKVADISATYQNEQMHAKAHAHGELNTEDVRLITPLSTFPSERSIALSTTFQNRTDKPDPHRIKHLHRRRIWLLR
jgi:hypothetical protein